MGDKTGIAWTSRTWNPWVGCQKVSAGCDFCYMFREQHHYGTDPETVRRVVTKTFNRPLRWQKEAAQAGRTELVFTCSWSDWFIREADEWRSDAWELTKKCPNLIFQILTKRPNRIKHCLPADWGTGYPNVWLGVSIESKAQASRADILLGTPAAVRFASVEPQLSEVPLWDVLSLRCPACNERHLDDGEWTSKTHKTHLCSACGHTWRPFEVPSTGRLGLDWIIYGGESGDVGESRPLDLNWIRTGLDECRRAGIAPFVKQLGSCWARENNAQDSAGGDMAEWPADLRVREFPAGYTAGSPIVLREDDETEEELIQLRTP